MKTETPVYNAIYKNIGIGLGSLPCKVVSEVEAKLTELILAAPKHCDNPETT